MFTKVSRREHVSYCNFDWRFIYQHLFQFGFITTEMTQLHDFNNNTPALPFHLEEVYKAFLHPALKFKHLRMHPDVPKAWKPLNRRCHSNWRSHPLIFLFLNHKLDDDLFLFYWASLRQRFGHMQEGSSQKTVGRGLSQDLREKPRWRAWKQLITACLEFTWPPSTSRGVCTATKSLSAKASLLLCDCGSTRPHAAATE